MNNPKNSIHKRLQSFGYAFTGIYELVKSEPNARIHLIATVCVVFVGFFLRISALEWCAVILSIALVLSAEAMNTVVEKLVDYLFKEQHETARIAKDISAGAVLICAIGALICGLVIFVPKVLAMI